MTLPLIYALSKPDATQRDEMRQMLTTSDVLSTEQIETLIEFAKREGGIDYAYRSMEKLQNEATAILSEYDDSEAKSAFLALFDFIIKRHK